MKKKIFCLMIASCCVAVIAGCSIHGPSAPTGSIYTGVQLPESAATLAMRTSNTGDVKVLKRGQASVMSPLGLFAFGDASIQAAMENGGITKVHHVDYKKTSFLGFVFRKLTIIVYGE